jgi:hypothetical protein
MVELDGLAEIAVGIHFSGEFPARIDHEWQVDFMRGIKRLNFKLVLENAISNFVAQGLGAGSK